MSFKKIFKKVTFQNENFSQLFNMPIFFKCVKMSQKNGVFLAKKRHFLMILVYFFKKMACFLPIFAQIFAFF